MAGAISGRVVAGNFPGVFARFSKRCVWARVGSFVSLWLFRFCAWPFSGDGFPAVKGGLFRLDRILDIRNVFGMFLSGGFSEIVLKYQVVIRRFFLLLKIYNFIKGADIIFQLIFWIRSVSDWNLLILISKQQKKHSIYFFNQKIRQMITAYTNHLQRFLSVQ